MLDFDEIDSSWSASRRLIRLHDQGPETMHHLLIGCPFSRRVWHDVLVCRATVPALTEDVDFLLYWASVTSTSLVGHQKCLVSLVILMAWSIWCFQNMCPFDNARPLALQLMLAIQEETKAWALAGAHGLLLIT